MRIISDKHSEPGGLTFYRMRLGDHAIELMATAKELQVEGRRLVIARQLWRARAELRRAAAG
jgi:hypothetical protein